MKLRVRLLRWLGWYERWVDRREDRTWRAWQRQIRRAEERDS